MGSTSNCTRAIQQLLLNDTGTAVQALDAFGKVPAGILTGNSAWWGDYDGCISLEGLKYCLINMQVNATAVIPSLVLLLNYGVCVPDVCTEEGIVRNIDQLTSIPALSWLSLAPPMIGSASPVNCQQFPQRPYDAGFICFTIFCIVLLLLMLGGTCLDVFRSYKKRNLSHLQNPSISTYGNVYSNASGSATPDENRPLLAKRPNNDVIENTSSPTSETISPDSESSVFEEILLCFAFNRNLRKILDTSQSNKSITCLNGIRVISISWVALGHTFIFGLMSGPENPLKLFNDVTEFPFQVVANGFLSVDTFFFMSGFLLAYLALSRMEKSNGKLSLPWFYFHRIWRLTPLYAFMILFMIYHHPYFGSGPVWYLASEYDSLCSKYWWRNLLYINNFFPVEELCMQWSWYLSNDMQFYIISPLILLLLYRWQFVGFLAVTCTSLASLVITAVLIGYYDLSTTVFGIIFGVANLDASLFGDTPTSNYIEIVYFKPYCRIIPYLVGMGLGYLIYKQATERHKISLSPVTVAGGWALASAIGMAVVYGTYSSYVEGVVYGAEGFPSGWNTTENILYGTFHRVAWSLALSWVLIACHYGYGGWINDFLSWSFWVPLSRLTYSAYLVHGLVIQTFYQSAHAPLHVSTTSASYTFCGCMLISYAAALLFSLAVEYPCANLEKMLSRSKKGDDREAKPLIGDDNDKTAST